MPQRPVSLTSAQARALWLRAQRLDDPAPFGDGPQATARAVAHLGYVQIDTINVIERSHHHILYTRIPTYARGDLEQAQSAEKSVFEYWTHALAYIPTADYRFFVAAMDRFRETPRSWFAPVNADDYGALLKRIRREGALSIRDIEDEVLVEKTHPWASRKPSKRVLGLAFFVGDLTIAKRDGMLKSYELTNRHFGWRRRPKAATDDQFAGYLAARALRAQGIVSLDSICFGNLSAKNAVSATIAAAVRRRRLVPVKVEGHDKVSYWAEPAALDSMPAAPSGTLVHILSPFDPLAIQRKRLSQFFDYEHRFEAYVPPARRILGYFALPVLVGDEIVAAIDLKTDRAARKLLVQRWTWMTEERPELKVAIEAALHRFEQFQLAVTASP
ncbi:hypothetical protein GCM10010994_43570 [Chelatococcus reniformis]|uniref:Cytoplasmic protein n=1 Tax=Chelatococcus reniformis TaxID=1494448 RepID=A0A916XLB5_9HYPH|nr:hypothetical protein GCM10010994_43570 [Chelatococcus reniformis]